jgi:hypothetical protein
MTVNHTADSGVVAAKTVIVLGDGNGRHYQCGTM